MNSEYQRLVNESMRRNEAEFLSGFAAGVAQSYLEWAIGTGLIFTVVVAGGLWLMAWITS